MKEILTCEQMKNLDAYTIEKMQLPSCVLMERAALCMTEELERVLHDKERVLVVCGSGNNGGDGMAVARMLFLHGIPAEIYFVGKEESMTRETARQQRIAAAYQVPTVMNPQWDEYTTIVDAIFGVGLTRPVEGRYAEIIRKMNAAQAYRAAVDIPSGINGDNGRRMGTAFRADMTVTFAYRKRGLCFYPGRMYAGKIVVADIGIYAHKELPMAARHLESKDLSLLPRRSPGGNKGTFGKVLVVGGCAGMCGAAFLSAAAALRAGAGMVQIQTVEENRMPLQILLPEAMVSCKLEAKENQRLLDWCDVLVIGPGLGAGGESSERALWFLENAGRAGKPVVLDADGLNHLAANPRWETYLNENVIVTPHMGEMHRLCGRDIEDIRYAAAETAQAYAVRTKAVCVLKDACTVVADAWGRLYLNLSGNAGMATAGSGDVLSGILAAVLCMYLQETERPNLSEQAALGVYLHGLCGDAAAQRLGVRSMTAGDIIDALPEVLKETEQLF